MSRDHRHAYPDDIIWLPGRPAECQLALPESRSLLALPRHPPSDLFREEGRVVADPPDQRGASRVLPRLAEQVETGRDRHPAFVHDASLLVFHLGDSDP
jgi:hypothetical protein